MKPVALAAAAAVAVLLAGCSSTPATPAGSGPSGASGPAGATTPKATQQKWSEAPAMAIDPAKKHTATVTTDVGEFTIELDAAKAPKTVNNFVFLAKNKYYDGVVFHRVIAGFMAQGGDPTGTGSGGPGYKFADELPKAGEYQIGSVAMANAGPNTNGSQFFIVTGAQGTSLPPKYSLFGKVTAGMDVVKKIEADGGDPARNGVPPKVLHTMVTVTVAES